MSGSPKKYGSIESSEDVQERNAKATYLFKYLLLTQMFMYLEAGAVPSLLQQFTLAFVLNPQEQGLLGAIVYFTIAFASPCASSVLRRYGPRPVLGYSLLANNFAVLVFACTPIWHGVSSTLLICMRGIVGLTQAFHCVYSPLWVHEYAPREKRGAWMSYLQAAAPIGITVGYFVGSVAIWSATSYVAPSEEVEGLLSDSSDENGTFGQSTNSLLFSMYQNFAARYESGSVRPEGNADATMDVCGGIYCWRWPFLVEFFAVLPFMILVFFIPREHLQLHQSSHPGPKPRRMSVMLDDAVVPNKNSSEEDSNSSENDKADDERLAHAANEAGNYSEVKARVPLSPSDSFEYQTQFAQLRELLQVKVYVFLVLGLSSLFFVVAGVQFWTTLYLTTNTDDSAYQIHLSYLIVSGTGPIGGVFFGGWLIDYFGGYTGSRNQANALKLCMILGIVGCLASLPISFFHTSWFIAIFLWLMLFCGGSLLPACSGIVISSTPHRLRPLASSVAYGAYNLFGYALSSYLPGFVMNLIVKHASDHCDIACTYRIGFRIVLFWSCWAFLWLTCAYADSKHKLKQQEKRGIEQLESRESLE